MRTIKFNLHEWEVLFYMIIISTLQYIADNCNFGEDLTIIQLCIYLKHQISMLLEITDMVKEKKLSFYRLNANLCFSLETNSRQLPKV